jgi:hypothetical protein
MCRGLARDGLRVIPDGLPVFVTGTPVIPAGLPALLSGLPDHHGWRRGPAAVRSLQPLTFRFDHRQRIPEFGEHLHNLRRIGLGQRAAPLLDRGPGAPHEQQPVTLGQDALRRAGHPAEVVKDELLGGKIRRAAHALIIPPKGPNVESHAPAKPGINRTTTHEMAVPARPEPTKGAVPAPGTTRKGSPGAPREQRERAVPALPGSNAKGRLRPARTRERAAPALPRTRETGGPGFPGPPFRVLATAHRGEPTSKDAWPR